MMEQILQYYETELEYMRRAFAEFELQHPQKAKALGLSRGKSTDPDVQRLADSVALHAARLSKRLDDTLPEAALDLMRIIAPSLLLGAPSYAAVKLDADAETLPDPVTLKKETWLPLNIGNASANAIFTVARETNINPCEITALRLERLPFSFDIPSHAAGCEAVICITISPFDLSRGLCEFGLECFELYVSASGGRKDRLIDVLAGDVLAVGYAGPKIDGIVDRKSNMLPQGSFATSVVQETGFLPICATESSAFVQLREFLVYPDKSAFFSLSKTDAGFSRVSNGPVELRLFLSSQGVQKLSSLEWGDLSINVVPVINLYRDRSAPLRYDYARMQVPVRPTTSSDMPATCLQIVDMNKLTSEGEIKLPNITSLHRRKNEKLPVWQERYLVGEFDPARREVSFSVPADIGEELPQLDVVADLLCSNGKMAISTSSNVDLFFQDDSIADTPFTFLSEPTLAVLPDVSAERLWDFLALINGNFSTVFDAEKSTDALKNILHLAAPNGYSDAAQSIWEVTITQSTAPLKIGKKVLLSAGSHIDLVLDTDTLSMSKHVFATALHQYFKSLISYDRFFKLSVRERGRTTPFKIFKREHGGQICG